MRQLKAEYYKIKYSRASRVIVFFMVLMFFLPFLVGNDTLFMTFGDYRNIDSIGWICYIDDLENIKAAEISRFALSINFFTWIGLIVYTTSMVLIEFQQGTIRASVVYGINRTVLFLSKWLILNLYYFTLYFIVEVSLGIGLARKYGFHYTGNEFVVFLGVAFLNMIAMLGMEAIVLVIAILLKNSGLVTAFACVYFFAGAITYPMVYENFENRSILIKIFCMTNPAMYMYNICGFQISDRLISGTIIYGFGACLLGVFLMHYILKRQEL
ncbi:hypothetical protein C823_001966 [Eubacterium plexicaudatum ASF492]|uniref:Uncharacterized protein n=1 Tax=Eubacterium plexicaudatum ASF492 TaxID=1235802 RepID=N2BFN6_9FIRM|nr:hypothetical protein C823_001966 [Eubacterium plexicaudatum ASF492]